jgi:isopenicillin-N N-acyltransferase-like protein
MTNPSLSLLTLQLTGSDPRTWGLQHGEAFAAQIRELSAIRSELLVKQLPGWSQAMIDRLCDDHLAALSQRWTDTLAELTGIGEASGVSLRELVVLNAYTDLKDFVASNAPAIEGGCSALVVKGPRVNFAAQTWDMHASAEPYTLLLDVPGAARRARVLTVAGCLGLAGVNAAGVSVMINNLNCRETNRAGLLWPGLVRKMLEQPTAASAVSTLVTNLPSSGHNYLVSDRGEAINLETTGRRYEQTAAIARGRAGVIGHTNHYLGTLASEELVDRRGPTTLSRMVALDAFFAAHPLADLTSATVQEAFLEQGALCDCVCFRPDPGDPHAVVTCGGIAVDHAAGTAFAFRGRYDAATKIEWKFGA